MIYLDHNATSPTRPECVAAMLPYFSDKAGNPSSVHGAGRAAREGLETARRRVAALLGVHHAQVIFTSGGSESNNLALFGMAEKHGFSGRLVVSPVEHPSVLAACEVLAARGMEVVKAPVDALGRVDVAGTLDLVDGRTVLVSVMLANNETGVLQPVREIAAGCRARGVPFHTDAIQAVGKVAVDFPAMGFHLLSISAHKFGGPKGVGALILDKSLSPVAQVVGGGQERGYRSGTENLPGIAGFGMACELATSPGERARLLALRERLEALILDELPDCVIFGQKAERLPNTTALGVAGLDGETLVMNLDLSGFAVSSGSACSSGRAKSSAVLAAMGVPDILGASLVRVSLGWNSRQEDVEYFAAAYVRVVKRLQRMSGPLAQAV